MRKPLKHREPEDRFASTLRPRRELFEALWNFALFRTRQRRRKANAPLAPLSRVNVWCQLRLAALLGCYVRHMKHLGEPMSMSVRTMQRHLGAFKAMELVRIDQERYFDRKRRVYVMRPNVYAITRRGQLWIKKHVDATKIPEVV